MKWILITMIMGFSFNTWALETEDRALSFREALMQSNQDYNTHKKNILDQENDRIGEWGQREVEAVTIEASIEVEARNYETTIDNSNENKIGELQQETSEVVKVLHEVSMNN